MNMGKFNNSGFFISGTILLLTSYIFAANEEDIYEMTAMSLAFLKAHEDRVTAHRAIEVDEPLKQDFIETWTGILGEAMTEDILNHIKKEWRYTLDLVNSNDNNITALGLAVFNKIEALTQGWYYNVCIMHAAAAYTNGYKPEHCRKLSAYYFLYSITGMRELIQKFSSVTADFISNDDRVTLQKIVSILTKDRTLGLHATLKPGITSAEEDCEFSSPASDTYCGAVFGAVRGTNPLTQMENLKLSMLFGHLEKAVREERLVHFVLHSNYMKALWNNGKDLSNWLTIGNLPDLGYRKSITDLMCEVLIQKAEVLGVNRRNEFESIKQANVIISLNNGVFSKTVN